MGICFIAPISTLAACEPGGTPAYQDVTGIAVRRCGTVGFIYESFLTADGYLVFHGVEHTPVKGYYDGHDGRVLFEKLLRTERGWRKIIKRVVTPLESTVQRIRELAEERRLAGTDPSGREHR